MKGGSLLAPAALSFASGLLGAVGKSCRLFRLSRDQAGTGTEPQKRNNAVKRAIPALAAIALSGLAVPAQAYDSAYTELDLDACPVIETYEVGADWLCEGYGGIAVLVSEGDLRFTVSYGKDAAAESAFGQGFGPFNDLGPRIEWLLEADGGIAGTILRWFVAQPDYEAPDHQILVVTRIEPGNTCHVAYIDARANANANALAREAAENLIPDFECARDRIAMVGDWAIPHEISAALME